jgi:hypothetical protein
MIRGCEGGGFDLTRLIRKQIKDKKKVTKGEMICKGKNGDFASNHSHIVYEVNVQYGKKKASPKPEPKKKEKASPEVKATAKPKVAKKAASKPKKAVKAKAKPKVAKKAAAKPKKAVKTKAKAKKKTR